MICWTNVTLLNNGFGTKIWVKGLEQWFPEGIETTGICPVKINAHRIQYWPTEAMANAGNNSDS